MYPRPFKLVTTHHQNTSGFKKELEEKLGIPIQDVNKEEAEKAAFVICCDETDLPSYFDGFKTECVDCSCKIGYSVNAPIKPDKVCVRCAAIRVGTYT